MENGSSKWPNFWPYLTLPKSLQIWAFQRWYFFFPKDFFSKCFWKKLSRSEIISMWVEDETPNLLRYQLKFNQLNLKCVHQMAKNKTIHQSCHPQSLSNVNSVLFERHRPETDVRTEVRGDLLRQSRVTIEPVRSQLKLCNECFVSKTLAFYVVATMRSMWRELLPS